MASGKSLELREIKPKPSWKCSCGGAWDDHLKKDGTVMKRYSDPDKHTPMGGQGFNRQQRRGFAHG